ncbi:HD domain-containing protein [Planctomicrobium piriforme]|uniref:HD domain-containing protein n=2 Tax=Planctomicrobium piriforme TaxID=1576369 RepID=A0A1I3EG60_9PLAN|nr:HD domain-containing protein [Planctomicrobium piriforme]
MHDGQVRKYTGRPYITHPMRVAGQVTLHKIATDELIAAAWLHDVVEDCNVSLGNIHDAFGPQVASAVGWLTNPSKGSHLPRAERKEWDRRHATEAPHYAQVMKLIDRLDNLWEIDPADKFATLYCKESSLLVDAIGYADTKLESEIRSRIEWIQQLKTPSGGAT